MSPFCTSASGPPTADFRRDVQHDGAEGGAAHARIGYPHHVLDAAARELLRDRQVARLRHARRAPGAGVAQHQHVVGGDVERGIVDPQRHVLDRFEHHGAAGVLQQPGACAAECLMTAPRGARLPCSTAMRAFRLDRIVAGPDRVWPGTSSAAATTSRSVWPAIVLRIEVEEIAELAHQPRHAAGMVEVLHVVLARRLQVDQHRHLAADAVEGFEIDADAWRGRRSPPGE